MNTTHELISLLNDSSSDAAMRGFTQLMTHVFQLYTGGDSDSISEEEGNELTKSTLYVLGFQKNTAGQILELLASPNVMAVWTKKRQHLEARIPQVMNLWQQVVTTMPPLRNIALRDTLISIETFPSRYDTFFAAHEIPCSIDYPLSTHVSDKLKGIDYLEAWLTQLLKEAQFLSHFETRDMENYLSVWCPDYKGLLINLYNPIFEAQNKGELKMKEQEKPPSLNRSIRIQSS